MGEIKFIFILITALNLEEEIVEGLVIKGLNGSLKFLLENNNNEDHQLFACDRKSIFCQVSLESS